MTDVVYFVRRDGLVKIGTTGDLSGRITTLNRGGNTVEGMVTSKVELLATMPGGRPVEKSIHETFASLRYDKEWFFLEEPLAGFVQAIAAAELIARARRARAFPRQSSPWTHVEEYVVPERLRTQPSPVRPASDPTALVTFREAVERGVLPWRYHAARQRMRRARQAERSTPQPVRREGMTDLYRQNELIDWAESELVP